MKVGINEHTDWDIFHFLVLSDEKYRINTGVLTALSSASAIGLPPVINHGTEAQKEAWLPGIFTGELQFCLGATEPTGGSDLANLKTTAKKTADGKFYIVNGSKVCLRYGYAAIAAIVGSPASRLTLANRNGSPALSKHRT